MDWVAFDAYDLPSYNGGVRSSVNTMFSSTMAVLKTLAPNKPLMIAETGCDAEHVNGFPNSKSRRLWSHKFPMEYSFKSCCKPSSHAGVYNLRSVDHAVVNLSYGRLCI